MSNEIDKIKAEIHFQDILVIENFYTFIKKFWHVIEPGTVFKDGWHVHAICLHLSAVTEFKIPKLIVNIPPRHMKSIIISAMWPAWVWLKYPHRKFIYASYSQSLALQDSVKTRDIILSSEYQRLISGAWELREDANLKSEFQNTKGGVRVATSVGGTLTGKGGDYLVADDPQSATEAHSEAIREEANRWWGEVMSSRANDPNQVGRVVIQQRLHESDLTGTLLKKGGYQHLVLPAVYESNSKIKSDTALNFKDPRTKDGELLWPERFDKKAIDELKIDMGSLASSGQLQQDPKPADGGMFKRKWWKWYREIPPDVEQIVQFWDCAQKPGVTNDYSVCATWAKTSTGFYMLDLWREKVEAPDLERAVKTNFSKHNANAVVIEDKSSGSSLIQTLLRETDLPVIPYDPGRLDKITRASAVTPKVESGRCFLKETIDGIEDFLLEHEKFPSAAHDDTVDTTSMMIEYFSMRGTSRPRVRTL